MKCEELFDPAGSLLGEQIRTVCPWEALTRLAEAILTLGEELSPRDYVHPADGVWIARSARVAEGVHIAAPCIVCEGAEIRCGGLIRGSALIGRGCIVGNSTEVKNAILFDGAAAPHFNYIGDSVLGVRAHLGAGVILSNVRWDGGEVVVATTPESPTGRRKLGGLIGDGSEVGCQSVINPGTVLGRGCRVDPLSSVRGVWAAGSHIRGRA